jgi:polyisoprenoid-binding protein YceI
VNPARGVYRGLRARRIFTRMNTTPQTLPSTTATLWTLDASHSTVGFRVRHLLITYVYGTFEKVAGTVRYDADRPEATRIDASISAASIHTREPQRDEHLRSPDFFDAANHPTVTFHSTRARKSAAGLEVTGDLTIRGTTRPVTLDVSEITGEHGDLQGKRRIGASATAKIRRSDFGMVYNKVLESGGLALGDEVLLSFDVSMVKG